MPGGFKFYEHAYNDVHLNIALEQAIFQYAQVHKSPTLRIWSNPRSVILGRTQSLAREINVPYCEEYEITITRRVTGGGAVYHDQGNLNLSFYFPLSLLPGIHDIVKATQYFTRFLKVVLEKLGYSNLEIENRSNLLWKNKKISGSAGRLRNSWFLHHATILHSANLDHLNNSLIARSTHPTSRNASRYYPTINLDHFHIQSFIEQVNKDMSANLSLESTKSTLALEEMEFAKFLKDKLYSRNEWIYKKKFKLYKIDSYQ